MAKKPKPKIVSKKHLARLEREHIQNRNIMIAASTILILVIAVIVYGVLSQTVLFDQQPVARVGSDVITTRQFEMQVRFNRYQLIQQYTQYQQMVAYFGSSMQSYLTQIESQLSDPTSYGSTVLDQMIDNVIIRQEAQKRGITVSTAEVDEKLQEAFGYYPQGSPTPSLTPTVGNSPTMDATQLSLVSITPTPTITLTPTITFTPTITLPPTMTLTYTPGGPTDNLAPTLAPTPTGPTPTEAPTTTETPYTQAGYQAAVKNFLDGVKNLSIAENDLRWIFENQIYQQKVSDAVTADLKPEDTKVWARHILVADEATANNIESWLSVGGNFAHLAAQYSTDTSTKDIGGDLGWFGKGVMDPTFEQAAFALKVGEISQPVQTQYGWHIIQVLGNQLMPLDGTEFQTLKQTTFTNWLTTTKSSRKDITKYDIWSQRVPTEPLFTPWPTQDLSTPGQ